MSHDSRVTVHSSTYNNGQWLPLHCILQRFPHAASRRFTSFTLLTTSYL